MPPYFSAKSAKTKGKWDKSLGKIYKLPIRGSGTGPGGKLKKSHKLNLNQSIQ